MNTIMKRVATAAACALALVLGGCFDEEQKVLDIVLTGVTYADFSQNETSEQWRSRGDQRGAGDPRHLRG